MRTITVSSLILISVLLAAASSFSQTTRPRLAIMDFSAPSAVSDRGYADSSRKSWGDPGRMMSELLTTHFAKSGRFDVVERARLYQLLGEKQINVGAGLLGDQAKTIGSELGVSAIVVGGYSPNAYGYEVSARVVSVADGSIMATENALVPADSAWMDRSMAILAGKLSAPWSAQRGYVLDVFLEADKLPLLMVDLGTAQGAGVGRLIEVSTAGDPIIHPITKENLGTRDVPLATACIIKAEREFSYARMMHRTGVVSTPAHSDANGIDPGVERLQRVTLTDGQADVTVNTDMSILSVQQQIAISSDIPNAQLLVDGKPTPLENGSASVRLGAGTHLVELQVGRLLLSREITVSKAGVRPKEVAFRKDELSAPAATMLPEPTAPAQGATAIARTAPELGAEDRKADDKLLSMLPKPEAIDEQLLAARDEQVTKTFEAGLKALRYGYAKGSKSYLSMAAIRFNDVTRLAPDLALGHFNLGLTKFYLDHLDDAKAAFAQAVKLDQSLKDDVPLLWWDDFNTLPGKAHLMTLGQSPTYGVENGVLWYKGNQARDGIVATCWDPGKQWSAQDVAMEVRFKMVSPKASMLMVCRYQNENWVAVGISKERVEFSQVAPFKALAVRPFRLGPGWHTARLEAVGTGGRLYLDGELVLESDKLPLWQGLADFGIGNGVAGEILIDWILVTRY